VRSGGVVTGDAPLELPAAVNLYALQAVNGYGRQGDHCATATIAAHSRIL